MQRTTAILAGVSLLAGCATMPTPRNAADAQYQPTQHLPEASTAPQACTVPALPAELAALREVTPGSIAATPAVMTPGDRIVLQVSGDKDVLSGTYVIAANGQLPLAPEIAVSAAGRTRAELERDIRQRLVGAQLVRDVVGNVRITQAESVGVPVSVEGAVFFPGVVTAGDRNDTTRATLIDHPAQGDYNAGRSLTTALQLAGGLRPDASPARVWVVRGGAYAAFDLSPALLGGTGDTGLPGAVQLQPGDRVIVPTTGCFDARLVRPSPVTAPGIRVYMSNLSRPAASNASSAIGRDATSLPYGTRFLQGLVSANCVGGSAMNAGRSAVLVSRNPVNGRAVVISRKIEALVRDADRDSVDPYLMPGDAIACYDSTAMTLVDAVGVLGTLLGPAVLINSLKP